MRSATIDTYDVIPYNSTPLTDTHPANLAAIGRWFGLSPADPTGCRVLELGCAAGGNIIPLAWYHPGMTLLGVDLSSRQIAAGQAMVDRLGLGNITLLRANILDLEPATLGLFDYILVHGVWSWVSPQVQTHILTLCRACLAPQGIAYISYNTLPGWRMRGMVRDMLLFHTLDLSEPRERLAAARSFLRELAVSMAEDTSVVGRYLAQEARELSQANPSYLFHEYLETTNTPILFADFAAQAAEYGLEYLAEAELSSMFPSTLPLAAQGLVAPLEALVEQEQYMDFVRHRHFRKTLLCHENSELDRDLDLDQLREFSLYAQLRPVDEFCRLEKVETEDFQAPDGTHYQVHHPLTKGALLYLAEIYPSSVAFTELEAIAVAKVVEAGGGDWTREGDLLTSELFALYAHRAVRLTQQPQSLYQGLPLQPRTHGLARAQVAAGLNHLATIRHTTLEIDRLAGKLVLLMDGTRTVDGLAVELAADLAQQAAEEVVTGGTTVPELPPEAQFRSSCQRLALLFARNGLLEAV